MLIFIAIMLLICLLVHYSIVNYFSFSCMMNVQCVCYHPVFILCLSNDGIVSKSVKLIWFLSALRLPLAHLVLCFNGNGHS